MAPTLFGSFEMDVVMERNPEYEAEVTDNPVETGFVVSDHIIKKQPKMTMTVIFSPTNVTWNDRRGGTQPNRITDVEKALETLLNSGEPTFLKTQDNVYQDMLLVHFTMPRNTKDGKAVKSTLEFRKVVRTSTETTSVPAAYASTATTTNDTTGADQTTASDQAGSTDTNAGDADTSDIGSSTNNADTEESAGSETAGTANKSIAASIADAITG